MLNFRGLRLTLRFALPLFMLACTLAPQSQASVVIEIPASQDAHYLRNESGESLALSPDSHALFTVSRINQSYQGLMLSAFPLDGIPEELELVAASFLFDVQTASENAEFMTSRFRESNGVLSAADAMRLFDVEEHLINTQRDGETTGTREFEFRSSGLSAFREMISGDASHISVRLTGVFPVDDPVIVQSLAGAAGGVGFGPRLQLIFVPEPASLCLFISGGAALLTRRSRKSSE